jgi:hypothetical protein
MDGSPKQLENAFSFERRGSSEPPVDDLSAFFKFPSLGRLFQGADRTALAEMRRQLTQTKQHLERVIRQGAKEDADRAVLISRAYDLTLTLLEELESDFAETAK